MQARAGEAEIQRALAYLADSVVYEHPRVQARILGRSAFGDGLRHFLGTTRQTRISIAQTLVSAGVVVTEQRVAFEVESEGGWAPRVRSQVTVFDVEDGRIARIVDFWQPTQ